MVNVTDKIILTDCDGVILNWEKQFHRWMNDRGYNVVKSGVYEIHDTYDIAQERAMKYVEEFNTSAYLIDLPPFKDALSGVATLKENGYKFIAITTVGGNYHTHYLRKINLENLFGKDTFVELHCLSESEGKKNTLERFKDSGLYWIEDLPKNAKLGADLGLRTLLIDHSYNKDFNDDRIIRVRSWKDICNIII